MNAAEPPMSAWFPLRPENIPSALRVLPCVLWRAEPTVKGKPAKVPYQIAEPSRRASSTDSGSWGSFNDAVEAYSALVGLDGGPRHAPVAGIGVVLLQERETSCIDLDRVIDGQGQLDPRAQAMIDRASSWTEISPSGAGVHIFVAGALPSAVVGDQIEIYSTARFIALTGHRWPDTPDEVRGGQAYLDFLWTIDHEDDQARYPYTGPSQPAPDDLAGALLARLHAWGLPPARIKRWSDGVLVELVECPWAHEHTSGPGGSAVMIRASGAYDFRCQHAHCARRRWREFRAAMEATR